MLLMSFNSKKEFQSDLNGASILSMIIQSSMFIIHGLNILID